MCYVCHMATRIPLRELKNQASAIVRRAEEGETFEVTVDGRLSAILSPARAVGPQTWVPVIDVVQLLKDVDFADAFGGPRPELGEALGSDDDPFQRYEGWLDS
jgi:prevent-host-death family protein